MHWILLISIACLPVVAFSQSGTIVGNVIDAQSGQPLELVNVYVNRTSIGTTTSKDGNFRLSVSPGNVEAVWSRVGYKTHKLTIPIAANEVKKVTVLLTAELTSLAEITVSAKNDKGWERQFNQFRKVFLGKDEAAEKCIITNKHVLEFTEEEKGGGFTAAATAPLEIINPMLGYRITYELVNFNYTRKTYAIAGNIQFEELASNDEETSKLWKRNRENAYRSSIRSFLKSMIDNRMEEDGFEAFVEKTYEPHLGRTSLFAYFRPYLNSFQRSSLVKDSTNNTYVLRLPARMEIHDKQKMGGTAYRDVRYQVSWVELTEPLHLSAEGVVYNQRALQLIGYLSESRVAHQLPENYKSAESAFATAETSLPTEQIYIHTDKEYYYPAEAIWLKGYMHYSQPALADSMSRVVYVELIDSAKTTISRKVFAIEYGTFDGEISIPSGVGKGMLVLRAYTEWMRNCDANHFFIKPIPILDVYERAIDQTQPEQKSAYAVSIQPQTKTYRFADSLKFNIAVVDAQGDTVPADMSLSVVDYDLIKKIDDAVPIQNAFIIAPEMKSSSFQLQRGITVKGKVTDFHHQATGQVRVTAVLGKFEDMTTVQTQADGTFTISGFHFNDSSTLSLQALNKKNKPFGLFTLVPQTYPSATALPEFKRPQVTKAYAAIRTSFTNDEDGGVLLKEVTVTAKREKPYKDLYTSGNITMSGDRIRELNPSDLMSLFMGRIPRVGVQWRMTQGGFFKQFVFIRRMGVPLIVIDGMPVEGETAMDMIKAINVRTVERIEVMADATASIYGSRGANGVIIILTRTQHGNFEGGNPDKFSTRDFSSFPVHGFSSFRPFVQSSSRDVSTVYWNPYVLSDANRPAQVVFKATANSSAYLITVKGFTRSGQPVSASQVVQFSNHR